MKTTFLIIVVSVLLLCPPVSMLSSAGKTGEISVGTISLAYRNVTMYAPAVAQTDSGYVGVISTITVTIQDNGNGRVFVDTLPLTQIDMQGSARLAVKVASAFVKNDNTTSIDPSQYDYFFVVRTSSPVIGGPSAGAVMTVATIALLENWTIDNSTVMTGMIDPDGSIGPIGGIPYKIDAANSVGARRFLIPKGQMEYTETVTETTVSNGWTQIVTHPVTRNVSEYAMTNYGIEVAEVEDVNDALLYMTGHVFSTPQANGEITTEQYRESMEPIASMLLTRARTSYENASDAFNNSTISNYYPFYYKNQITDIYNEAKTNLLQSESWFDQELFYTSTSKSFQSLIGSRFVSYACEYFNSTDEKQYILSLLTEATDLHTNRSNEAKNADIVGMISLQCVGAAQTRVFEAQTYLDDAQSSISKNDYLTALYKIAFAIERSESVGWWLRIGLQFNDTNDINASSLSALTEEYIDDAQQAVTYSGVILDEVGQSSQYLTDAETFLSSARDEQTAGYPAAALFKSLEALVNANLALELVDSSTKDRIDRAQERASISIGESRARGIEPVLAVSYYEYAQSLANESSFDSAIVYYKYSDLIAGALRLTTSVSGGQSSRYLGVPDFQTRSWWSGIFASLVLIMLFFLLGGLTGFGIGLIIWGLSSKQKKNKYFSDQQMPRSIEDYYKKNK